MVWVLLLLAVQDPAWDDVRLNGVLRKDGAIEVSQTMVWGGPPGKVRFGLDRAGLESINDIALLGGGLRIQQDIRTIWLEWDAKSGQSYELSYVVWGSVRAVADGAELEWRLMSQFREAPVVHIQASLLLPRILKDEELALHADSGCRLGELRLNGDSIEYEGDTLAGRKYVVLRARLPEGLVEPPFLLNRELKLHYGTALLFALPGATLLLLMMMYLLRGRDPRIASDEVSLEKMTPALAGLVLDEHAGAPEATATIADLLNRGVLEASRKRLKLIRTEGLADFERLTIASIFGPNAGPGASAAMDKPAPKGAPDGGAVTDAIYRLGVAEGFFRRSPEKERRNYQIAGWAVLLAGVLFAGLTTPYQDFYPIAFLALGLPMMLIALSHQLSRPRATMALAALGVVALVIGFILITPWLNRVGFTWHAKLATGITLCGPILMAFAPVLPVKTIRGAEAKERAAATLRALDDVDAETFQEWLPHAIAFRKKKPYIHRLAEAGANAPSWWAEEEPLSDHANELVELFGLISARYGRETAFLGGG